MARIDKRKRKNNNNCNTVMYIIKSDPINVVRKDKIVKLKLRTYVGVTNDLKKRIRQHNGEIKGGAKSTRGRKWEYVCYISGFPNRKVALQYEWRAHHSLKKFTNMDAVMKRLKQLMYSTIMKRVTKSAPLNNKLHLTLHWYKKYKEKFDLILTEQQWHANMLFSLINKI